jgi:hypothetical protein
MTYLWDGTHAYRDHANGRVIEPGDEIPDDLVDQLLESHPYDVVETTNDDGADSEPVESPPVDPTTLTVDELEEALANEDYDWNVPALHGLRRAESNGDDRSGAHDAIDEKRSELEE